MENCFPCLKIGTQSVPWEGTYENTTLTTVGIYYRGTITAFLVMAKCNTDGSPHISDEQIEQMAEESGCLPGTTFSIIK